MTHFTDVVDKPPLPEGSVYQYRCDVCTHEHRADIDQLLVTGNVTLASISDDYGMSTASLCRHRAAHLAPALRAAMTEAIVGDVRSTLVRMHTRGIQLDQTYQETGSPAVAKIALDHDQSYLKATGNWREGRDLTITGNMALSPADRQDSEALEWMRANCPDQADRYLAYCESKLLAKLPNTLPIQSDNGDDAG